MILCFIAPHDYVSEKSGVDRFCVVLKHLEKYALILPLVDKDDQKLADGDNSPASEMQDVISQVYLKLTVKYYLYIVYIFINNLCACQYNVFLIHLLM